MYRWLVIAHAARRGWDPYWSGRSEVTRYWQLIRERMPERWEDFIRDTLRIGEPGSTIGLRSYLWFERLVDYLCRVGQGNVAADVTRQVVVLAKELTGATRLPECPWLES